MSKSKARMKKSRPVATERDPFAQGSSPSSENVAAASSPSSAPSSPSSLEAMSIPPVTEDIGDEPFFARDSVPVPADELEDDDDAKERALRETPEVRARVARARRLVSGLVAAAAILLVGGVGAKLLEGKGNAAVPSTQAAASPVAVTEPKPAAPQVEAAKPVEAPKPAEAPVAAAKPVEPEAQKPAAEAPKPAAEPAAPAAPAASSDAPTKTALEEKKEAQRLLDRGKSKDAIAAGERSVALDPADGEAWLLLGAAYQEQGKMADARRCYQACIKEGKRGPKGECAAMLR
ncbi:MAG: tetratricopeptide repeat protein [Polyangiaceae bacterium]